MSRQSGYENYAPMGSWVAPKHTETSDKDPSGNRAKHVLRTGTVPHAWAHPLGKDGSGFYQTHARNSQGNIFYRTSEDGTRVLFSYRNSYQIGSLFLVRKGKTTRRVYLTLGDKPYSVTTAGHMNMCRGAVPKDAVHWDVLKVVSGYNTKPTRAEHVKNVAFLASEYEATVAKLAKAKSEYTLNWRLRDAVKQRHAALDYAKFFNVKTPVLAPLPTITSSRRAKACAFDAVTKARREAAIERRRAEYAQEDANRKKSLPEKIAAWRLGQAVGYLNLDHTLLRLTEANGSPHVETTQGVKVPVNGQAGAARLFHFLKALYEAKREYIRNGHTQHIGNFSVDSFKPETLHDAATPPEYGEYVLTAGCHVIKWSEIEAIAPAVLACEVQQIPNHKHTPHNPDTMQTVCETCGAEIQYVSATDTWK